MCAAPPLRADSGCTQLQTWGWVVGSTGAAGFVLGTVLGGMAIAEHDIHQDHCDDATGTCDQQGIDARESGEVLGAASTATLIVSGGMVVAGLVMILGGGERAEQVALVVDGRTAELAITW